MTENLPFTAAQFFDVFAAYNRSFAIVAVAFWLAAASMCGAALWRPREWTGPLIALLAAMWVWNAVAYHALLFTAINPAAWVFAALFAIEGGLLAWAALGGRLGAIYPMAPLSTAGIALAGYALAYPLLNLALADYPRTPTFGVPCPTAILTIGILLAVRHATPWWLALIPAVWSVVGGSAALMFGVWTDTGLLAAGALLAADVIVRRVGAPRRNRV